MTAPLSALTDTWNAIGTVFTAIKMTVTDTASAATSRLFALIVGANDKFVVEKDGTVFSAGPPITAPLGVQGTRTINNDNLAFSNWPDAIPILGYAEVSGGNTTITNLFGATNFDGGPGRRIPVLSEICIADVIANDFGVYGPFVGAHGFDYHITTLTQAYAGDRMSLELDNGSPSNMNFTWLPATSTWQFGRGWNWDSSQTASGNDASGVLQFGVNTVAALNTNSPPATVGVGARAFVTDANTTVILGLGLTVVGGGANKVPVYSDGTNWKIG